jgi:hypothetical protein
VATCLVIRPAYDDATEIAREWAELAIAFAHRLGHSVIDLDRTLAVRTAVEGELNSESVDLILFYGHGDHRSLLGNDRRACIDESSASLLSTRVTYAVACKSAAILADRIGRQQDAAYVGYGSDVEVPEHPAYQTRVATAITSVAVQLLDGATVEAAAAMGRSDLTRLIDDLDEAGDVESRLVAGQAAELRETLAFEGSRFKRTTAKKH